MSGNQTEGTFRTVAGKAESMVGAMTGDTGTEMRGKARQVAGQAQSTLGEAVETVRDIATDQPMIALALAAGIGFVAGMLMTRR
jgi:uncharacterized protein YjbJ (UPF0337 family)